MVSRANGCSEIWSPEVEGCEEMREFVSPVEGFSGFVILVVGERVVGGGDVEVVIESSGAWWGNVGDVGVEAET